MSKETFKIFVHNNPKLIDFVNNNQMTWQKFYELFDLYGEDKTIWSKYLLSTPIKDTSSLLGDTSLKDIFNTIKKIDLDTVKKGVDGLQKAVGLLQDINLNRSSKQVNHDYQARPIYKYFED